MPLHCPPTVRILYLSVLLKTAVMQISLLSACSNAHGFWSLVSLVSFYKWHVLSICQPQTLSNNRSNICSVQINIITKELIPFPPFGGCYKPFSCGQVLSLLGFRNSKQAYLIYFHIILRYNKLLFLMHTAMIYTYNTRYVIMSYA